MSTHPKFTDLEDNSARYSELDHDARLALWREQYERSPNSGAPAPNLPHDVEQAVIRAARHARSQIMSTVLSWPFRQLVRLLRAAWRRGR